MEGKETTGRSEWTSPERKGSDMERERFICEV